LLTRSALEARLGLALQAPTILASYHPVTILKDTTVEGDALFSALAQAPGQLLFVYPNADAGSYALIERTKALAASRPHTHIFVNLDPIAYWSILGQVDALIGNSSSGIMEAASFALPAVNVGLRQQGRERARNVIDAPAETAAILRALNQALDPEFRRTLRGMENLDAFDGVSMMTNTVVTRLSYAQLPAVVERLSHLRRLVQMGQVIVGTSGEPPGAASEGERT